MPNQPPTDADTIAFPEGMHPAATLPPTESASPGTLPASVPGYRLLAEVGRGGMGVVYKAHHLQLNRVVALKMILAGGHAEPLALLRFRQEAETVARLQHPNIVQIYEVGAHAGVPYFALEYVAGGSLAKKTAGAPQPPHEAARLVELLAHAVEYAHQGGIIHRDLKPDNVLLTADGAPKLTDFGLAHSIGEADGLTATGAILGTPGYLAPEQANASRADFGPATDVYGLGAILYCLLTGRPPFQAATTMNTIMQTIEIDPVRPTQLRPGLSRDLETICLKCLQKAPAKRYATAAALAEDLHHFLADEPIRARPVGTLERGWRWAKRKPAVAGLVTALGLLLTVGAVGGLAFSVRLADALAVAQSDRDKAVAAEAVGKDKLLQALMAEAQAKRFSRRTGQRFQTLAAIRKAVALARELDKPSATFAELRNVAIAAMALPDLRPAPEWISDPEEPAWTSHMRDVDRQFQRYAVTNQTGAVSIRRVGDAHGGTGELARLPALGTQARVDWNADGRFLAVWAWPITRLQVWRMEDAKPVLTVDERTDCVAYGFSPDGRQLVTVNRGGLLRVYDLASGKVESSVSTAAGAWEYAAVHPHLPQVALALPNAIGIVDRNTGKQVVKLPTAGKVDSLSWHPDGELLAATVGNSVEVWDVPRGRRNWSREHRGGGLQAFFNPEGDVLGSRAWGARFKMWDPYSGQEVLTTIGWGLSFGSRGRLAMQFIEDGSYPGRRLPLCQFETGREYRTLVAGIGVPGNRDYWSGHIHRDGRLVAVATTQGVSLMDLAVGCERHLLPIRSPVLRFEPSGSLLTNSEAGFQRWPVTRDPRAPHRLRIGPPEAIPIRFPSSCHFAHSADGSVLVATNLGGAYVWPRDHPTKGIHLQPHRACCWLAVSPGGDLVATGAHHGPGLKVWNARTGQLIRDLLPDTPGHSPAFTPDGRWLLNNDGRCWRVVDWSEEPHRSGGAFAPDLRLRACSIRKGVISLIEPATGRELAQLEDPHQDGLNDLTFSPDGTQLLGTTNDSFCVRVWDLRLLRQGLVELGLDWDTPPYPPKPKAEPARPIPLQIEIVGA